MTSKLIFISSLARRTAHVDISYFLEKYKNACTYRHKKFYEYVIGRMISLRNFGKLIFIKILDQTGVLQIVLQNQIIGNTAYSLAKSYKIGFILSVRGFPFITKTQKLSLKVLYIKVIAKNKMMFPEKWHGLKNINDRYTKRYIDLILNKKTMNTFRIRTLIIENIRRFLNKKKFLEVETPILSSISGGASADPFITYHNSLSEKLELRIATELSLKKLLIGSINRVYEIGKSFRNEGIDSQHNPEFTSIEFYQAYSNYQNFIYLTERLLYTTVINIFREHKLIYSNNILSFYPPFSQISISNVLYKQVLKNFNRNIITDRFSFIELLKLNKVYCIDVYDFIRSIVEEIDIKNFLNFINGNDPRTTKKITINNIYSYINRIAQDEIIYILSNFMMHTKYAYQNFYKKIILRLSYVFFETKIEKTIIQPTFVIEHPLSISPLAKEKNNFSMIAERFEMFCGGMEIANSFSELNNTSEQRYRFESQLKNKKLNGLHGSKIDNEFIVALAHGMPPAAGEGIGIDRLTMLMTNNISIKEVVFFPKVKK